MKRKALQSLLQDVQPFHSPNILLEQYPTQPHLATQIVYTIGTAFENVSKQTVVDLGCGTGILAIGCALMDSPHVVAVDIDDACLSTAVENTVVPIDFVQADVEQIRGMDCFRCDIVVMNPPFGTRRQHIDRQFLETAFSVATSSVFSLHKTSTREFIQKVASSHMAVESAEVVAELRYDLPKSYQFHKLRNADIAVDFWRFVMKQ